MSSAEAYYAAISKMPPAEQARLAKEILGKPAPAAAPQPAAVPTFANPDDDPRLHFLPFLRSLWPGFIEGRHHKAIANAFERITAGTLKRLIINIGPRHGKSESGSIFFPAWYLGKNPAQKVILATHSEKLSFTFGRRVRNLIRTPEYHELFPTVEVSKDSKAAGRWTTTLGGEYFAIGAEGRLAGRGANLLVIDDPHSEQDALSPNDAHYEKLFEWYLTGPRQRLQPRAAIVIVMTRWSKKDLCGKLIKAAKLDKLAEQWEVLSLPALLTDSTPLFPEFWPLEELLAIKRNLPPALWNAQYQQNPTSEEAAIVKRSWWRKWEMRAPKIEFLIQSWDTSFGEFTKGDPSACVDLGIFRLDCTPGATRGTPRYGIMLLDAFSARLQFPELKQKALELFRLKKPDSLCIEARAAGEPLLQELRRMGLPVIRYAPVAGDDKVTRLNAVSDLFRSGLVFYMPNHKTEEVVEQVCDAPYGDHDDLADATVQALMRFREGGWIRLDSDVEDDADLPAWRPPSPPPGEVWY